MQAVDWFNEPDWIASENPHHLLAILERQGVKSGRKFRLAAVACCRSVWDRLSKPCRAAVEISERYADREVTYEELRAAADGCEQLAAHTSLEAKAVLGTLHREPRMGVQDAVYYLLGCAWGGPRLPEPRPPRWQAGGAWDQESRRLADLIRDIFGNPFRRVAVTRRWRTVDVTGMARAAYGEGNFDHLPIVADALEEAGCDDPVLLAHCRGHGTHVRGCWAIDALLGRK